MSSQSDLTLQFVAVPSSFLCFPFFRSRSVAQENWAELGIHKLHVGKPLVTDPNAVIARKYPLPEEQRSPTSEPKRQADFYLKLDLPRTSRWRPPWRTVVVRSCSSGFLQNAPRSDRNSSPLLSYQHASLSLPLSLRLAGD
jgi:hypothetical protein